MEASEASVPTSTTSQETTCICTQMDNLWHLFRDFKFDQLAPGRVKSVVYIDGQAGLVGSTVAITYQDESVWTVRITEISDKYHRICFDLITTTPASTVSSVETEIQLTPCTFDNETFVSWTTEFSNDCTANTIQDSKYKKHDMFKELKTHFSAK